MKNSTFVQGVLLHVFTLIIVSKTNEAVIPNRNAVRWWKGYRHQLDLLGFLEGPMMICSLGSHHILFYLKRVT